MSQGLDNYYLQRPRQLELVKDPREESLAAEVAIGVLIGFQVNSCLISETTICLKVGYQLDDESTLVIWEMVGNHQTSMK